MPFCCGGNTHQEEERYIVTQGSHVDYRSIPQGSTYSDNNVVSSSYTWWNFIPKNLFEQFSNLANLYFLFIGVLQIIPQISTTNGNPSMYQPLAFIVFVSGLRAASEDIAKHRADNKRNSYLYDVLIDGQWKPTPSGNIAVGNIVRVKKNEMIPADMLLLGSSNKKAHCFIDKANLNGETKLEVYSSIRETAPAFPCLRDGATRQEVADELEKVPTPELLNLNIELKYELPNKRFDQFRGTMMVSDGKGGKAKEVRCDGHVLLMRETNLKNTDFIYGYVVYTGNDTKIQRSNLEGERPKAKVSRILRQVNTYLIWMFIFQALLCILGGILAGVWYSNNYDAWYMIYDADDQANYRRESVITGVLAFFTWYINLCQLVPISLIVSGEMVKFAMSYFINFDVSLYHEPISKPTHCNSSTIHDDLGLVDYIFSDKTGTLTQNKMEFRYCMVSNGSEYGSKLTDIARSVIQRQQELEKRLAGTYVPPPPVRWTELARPYLARRRRNPRNHYDYDCADYLCWGMFSKCWSKTSRHGYDDGDDDESQQQGDEAEIIPQANTSTTPDNNTFSSAEQNILLQALYPDLTNVAPNSDEYNALIKQRDAIALYMTHMVLSNTVKPYYEGDDNQLKFQPESAEELAMVTFAQKLGYIKLPEKEDKDKTAQELQLGANTFVEIRPYKRSKNGLMIPDSKSEPIHSSYALLGCLGFTSARARVTLIYRDISNDKILIMIKGQDTTVLPFVSLGEVNDEEFMATLKECGDNGLRTLITGHAEQPLEWWNEWGKKYNDLKNSVMDENDKAKAEHELYEQIETSAHFIYLGCIGLEDQLQNLVPECIQSCLRAGIKVWMITGDKLETARNIALACNLIEADMQPQIKAGIDPADALKEVNDARLIEVTGDWNKLFNNIDELHSLFRIIDTDRDGYISVGQLSTLCSYIVNDMGSDELIDIVQGLVDGELMRQAGITVPPQQQQSKLGSKQRDDNNSFDDRSLLHTQRGLYPHGSDATNILTPPLSITPHNSLGERENSFMKGPQDMSEDSLNQQYGTGRSTFNASKVVSASSQHMSSHVARSIIASNKSQHVAPVNPQQQIDDTASIISPVSPASSVAISSSLQQTNNSSAGTGRFSATHDTLLSEDVFVALMQTFKRTAYEAVAHDIQQGLIRYHTITDHDTYPISVLISRDAFLVLFPGKEQQNDPDAPNETDLELLRRKFFFLASVSKSLVFARAQPAMKKKMVTEIQARIPDALTLAIGDGANDVDMITAAHVGIGISGVEGTAATNSSDYAIGTFRMLHTLLFVHGFWCYQRFSSLVVFIFYKAAIIAFTGFLFGIDSAFSGQQFMNDPLLQVYNIIFTSLPIIVLAILDKQLPRNTCEDNPIVHREQKNQSFNFFVFALWILRAGLHSVGLYFIPRAAFINDTVRTYSPTDTLTMDLWFFSTTVFMASCLLPTFIVFFINKSIHILNIIVFLISLFCIFIIPYILNVNGFASFNSELTGVVAMMYSSPAFWLTLAITIMIPMVLELSWQGIVVQWWPSLTQVLHEKLYLSRRDDKAINKLLKQELEQQQHAGGQQNDMNMEMSNVDGMKVPHGNNAGQHSSLVSTVSSPVSATYNSMDDANLLVTDASGAQQPNKRNIHDRRVTMAHQAVIQGKTNVYNRPVLQPSEERNWQEVKRTNALLHVAEKLVGPESTKQDKNGKSIDTLLNDKHAMSASHLSDMDENVDPAVLAARQEKEQLRSAFIRALLRMKTQAQESQFDSAARAEYQKTAPHQTTQIRATKQSQQQQSQKPITTTTTTTTIPQQNLFTPVPSGSSILGDSDNDDFQSILQ